MVCLILYLYALFGGDDSRFDNATIINYRINLFQDVMPLFC